MRRKGQTGAATGRESAKSLTEFYRRAPGDLATIREKQRRLTKATIGEIQNAQIGKDLIDTTLAVGSWSGSLIDTSGRGLVVDSSIQLPVEYASYMHQKQTPRWWTFEKMDVDPIVEKAAVKMLDSFARFTADRMGEELANRMADAIADEVG